MHTTHPALHLARRMLLLAPIPVALIALNLYVDPTHVITRPEARMVDLLLAGSPTTIPQGYDQRLFQLEFSRQADSPEVLVTGSSRSGQVHQGYTPPGVDLYNANMSMCHLLEHLAIAELYRDPPPRVHVMTLDPWTLNANMRLRRSRLFAERASPRRFRLPAGIRFSAASRSRTFWRRRALGEVARELISPGNAQDSLRQVLGFDPMAPAPAAATPGSVMVKDLDGSSIQTLRRLNRPANLIDVAAWNFAFRTPYGAIARPKLDPDYLRTLERFLHRLRDQGTRPILVLPPLHPVTYQMWVEQRDYWIVPKSEALLKRLAQRLEVPCLGSFDPAQCGATREDFVDGIHPSRPGVDRLFGKDLRRLMRDALQN